MKLRDSLVEGVNDPGILKAIFLAGGPGSGKSFVGNELIGIPDGGFSGMQMTFAPSGLKLVNSDIAFTALLKKIGVDPKKLKDLSAKDFEILTAGPHSVRGKAKSTTKAQESLYLGGRLGLVIDGTAHDLEAIKEKKTKLEKLGYDTYMIFINTSLEKALERNRNRERSLPEDLVTSIWKEVQSNLGRLQSIFKGQIRIIDNSKDIKQVRGRNFPDKLYSVVNKFVKSPVKNRIGQKWIEAEKARIKRS